MCHLHINSSPIIPSTNLRGFDRYVLLTELPQLVWLQPFQLFLQLLSVEPSLTWHLKWCQLLFQPPHKIREHNIQNGGSQSRHGFARPAQKPAPNFRCHLFIYILHQNEGRQPLVYHHPKPTPIWGSKSYKRKLVFQSSSFLKLWDQLQWRNDS